MPTLKILALCGSLRAQSSNGRLLRVAQQLAPRHMEITFFPGLGELPHFNPDLDSNLDLDLNSASPPEAVAALRATLQRADGVLICTPEYVHGLPGTFKNALDWTVSSGEWMGKPALILKSSRSDFAHDSLVEILTTLMAQVSVCPVALVGNGMEEVAMLADPKIALDLAQALEKWAQFIATHSVA